MIPTVKVALAFIAIAILIAGPGRKAISSYSIKNQNLASERDIIGSVAENNPRVEEIQSILKQDSFYSGPLDGRLGEETRRAIKNFQEANGLKSSGFINSQTWTVFQRQIELTQELSRKTLKTKPIVNRKDLTGPANLIQKGVQGGKNLVNKESTTKHPLRTKRSIKQAQKALMKAGYYAGDIDGDLTYATKKAIKSFQKDNKLKPDGIVGPKTWKKLESITSD